MDVAFANQFIMIVLRPKEIRNSSAVQNANYVASYHCRWTHAHVMFRSQKESALPGIVCHAMEVVHGIATLCSSCKNLVILKYRRFGLCACDRIHSGRNTVIN